MGCAGRSKACECHTVIVVIVNEFLVGIVLDTAVGNGEVGHVVITPVTGLDDGDGAAAAANVRLSWM